MEHRKVQALGIRCTQVGATWIASVARGAITDYFRQHGFVVVLSHRC